MKRLKWCVVLSLYGFALGRSVELTPGRQFFRYTRDVSISQTGKQNYLAVDAAMWAHAQPDLSDVRLFDGNVQVPYSLSEEQGASSTVEREARILNLGVVGGRTEFDLDVGGEVSYNQVQLRLKAKNFVTAATAEGRDALGGTLGRKLSTSTLYDFSGEGLGSNFALRIPLTTFRYLHITITPVINPRDITGASTSARRDDPPTWISAGHCGSPEQAGRVTRIVCDLDSGAPVGRILFTVPPGLANFRRAVNVSDTQGVPLCDGYISRVRMKSGSKEVTTEDLALGFCSSKVRQVRIEIDNGDNTPLPWERTEPQAMERRIYFDPAGKAAVKLYYGDEKLRGPEYDYARFFHKGADVARAVIANETLNPSYTGRPDGRPWSERHKWILWAAMLLAMVVLATLALKGFASGAQVAR